MANIKATEVSFDGSGKLQFGFKYTPGISPSKVKIDLIYRGLSTDFGKVNAALQAPTISKGAVQYALDLSKLPLSLTRPQLLSTYIGVVADPLNAISEDYESDNTAFVQLPFVRKIPQMQDNLSSYWGVASRFQKKWFNATAKTWPSGKLSSAFKKADQFPVEVLDHNWIFNKNVDTDGRATQALKNISSKSLLFSPNAISELNKQVRSGLSKVDAGGSEFTFGAKDSSGLFPLSLLSSPWSFKKIAFGDLKSGFGDYFQKQLVSSRYSPLDPFNTKLDPLTGALGNFNFFAYTSGSGDRITGPRERPRYRIQITGIDIVAIDVFEFNGSQPLAYWSSVSGPSAIPGIDQSGATGKSVFNGDYRAYRAMTGMGGDFVVMSTPIHLQPANKIYPSAIYDALSGSVSWSDISSDWMPVNLPQTT